MHYDDNDDNKIINFPNDESIDIVPHNNIDINDEDLHDELYDVDPIISDGSNPRVLTDVDKDKSLEELIKDITNVEVKRLYKNIDFLDSLEQSIKEEVQIQMELGTLTLENLLTIMEAFGKSVDRSNKIIKDKNSPLLNVFIDNRQQTQVTNVNVDDALDDDMLKQLDRGSRKKITKLLSAFISASQQEDEENEEIEVENENQDR